MTLFPVSNGALFLQKKSSRFKIMELVVAAAHLPLVLRMSLISHVFNAASRRQADAPMP